MCTCADQARYLLCFVRYCTVLIWKWSDSEDSVLILIATGKGFIFLEVYGSDDVRGFVALDRRVRSAMLEKWQVK